MTKLARLRAFVEKAATEEGLRALTVREMVSALETRDAEIVLAVERARAHIRETGPLDIDDRLALAKAMKDIDRIIDLIAGS